MQEIKPTLILQMRALVLTKDMSTEKDGHTFYAHTEVHLSTLLLIFLKAQWCLVHMFWQQLTILISRR